MRKIFYKAALSFLCIVSVILFSCCKLLIDAPPQPLESPRPEITSVIELEKPQDQSDVIKPFFIGNIPEEQPRRYIENAEHSYVVKSEEDLLHTVMRGYKPLFPAGSEYRTLYTKALEILNTIITNDMSDYQKTLAIYEYLIYYSIYDYQLLQDFTDSDKKVTGDEDSFNLKGVLINNLAVCDGFSKAFSLFCGIEGIESVRITGKAYSENYGMLSHAWNKVKLNGQWYTVDATYGNFVVERESGITEYLTHAFFLTSDDDITHIEEQVYSGKTYKIIDVRANNDYGYYQNEYIPDYEVISIAEEEELFVPRNYVFEDTVSLNLYLTYLKGSNIRAAEIYSTMDYNTVKTRAASFLINTFEIRENVYFLIW